MTTSELKNFKQVVEFSKLWYKKGISTLLSLTPIKKIAVNNNIQLAKISLKNAQSCYKKFFPNDKKMKKFHSQKLHLKHNKITELEKQGFIHKKHFSAGRKNNWQVPEQLQFFAKVTNVVNNFRKLKNYSSVVNYFEKIFYNKSKSNIEGNIENMIIFCFLIKKI